MKRMIVRLGLVLAALLTTVGLTGAPANAATVTPMGMGFTCSFDVPLGGGVSVDICLERVQSPGLKVRAITWLQNYSSQVIQAQFTSQVAGVGGALCGMAYQYPGTVRACQSSLYWDFDGPDDHAVSSVVWKFLGAGGLTPDIVTSPTG